MKDCLITPKQRIELFDQKLVGEKLNAVRNSRRKAKSLIKLQMLSENRKAEE